jgi:hypothetical protein
VQVMAYVCVSDILTDAHRTHTINPPLERMKNREAFCSRSRSPFPLCLPEISSCDGQRSLKVAFTLVRMYIFVKRLETEQKQRDAGRILEFGRLGLPSFLISGMACRESNEIWDKTSPRTGYSLGKSPQRMYTRAVQSAYSSRRAIIETLDRRRTMLAAAGVDEA